MRKKNGSASVSEEYLSGIRDKRRRLIIRKKRRRLSIIVVMAACVVITSILIVNHTEQKQVLAVDNLKVAKGADETNNLKEAKKDTATTEKNERKTENSEQTVSDKTVSKNNGESNSIEINYQQFFKKDVFIGDSITEGMADYDFLDEANVCAKLGINLTQVDEQIARAKNLQPEKIFLLLGANDLEYEGTTPAIFKERYKNVIHKVKESMPNSKIYVQSILPVLAQASRSNSIINNTRIGQFNAVIEAMASEENITYLNIASLINDSNKNLYEPDGIHFNSKFYALWLNYIKLNAK